MQLFKMVAIVLGLAAGAGLRCAAAQDASALGQPSFDFHGISSRSCDGQSAYTPWQVGIQLVPSAECATMIGRVLETEPACADTMEIFEVAFSGGAVPALAESVASTRQGIVFIDTFEPWARSAGNIAEIQSITKRRVCRDRVQTPAHGPAKLLHRRQGVGGSLRFQDASEQQDPDQWVLI